MGALRAASCVKCLGMIRLRHPPTSNFGVAGRLQRDTSVFGRVVTKLSADQIRAFLLRQGYGGRARSPHSREISGLFVGDPTQGSPLRVQPWAIIFRPYQGFQLAAAPEC